MNVQLGVPPNTPVAIAPQDAEHYWSDVEAVLRILETWTQSFAADDVRVAIANGVLQLWSVLDKNGAASLAVTGVASSARGSMCVLWLLASPNAEGAAISALADRVEDYSRQRGCAVLEIRALPGWAGRLKGKFTSVSIERDTRTPRRTN